MRCERIHAVDTWRNGASWNDCVFVSTDSTSEGMRGFDIARLRLFFSFKHEGIRYPCALIHWYSHIGDSLDENTGMWVVRPDIQDGTQSACIVHLDTIFRTAHLLPVYWNKFVPSYLDFSQTLDAFHSYYVNKYIDHHAFKIASQTWLLQIMVSSLSLLVIAFLALICLCPIFVKADNANGSKKAEYGPVIGIGESPGSLFTAHKTHGAL
jgi:hypothetical protein